jgi:hypothetical protein
VLAGVVVPPRDLPGFPEARRAKPKTSRPGGLRARWRDGSDRIYEWDYQHGNVELYDRRGRHLGGFDPETGTRITDADPARRVEP